MIPQFDQTTYKVLLDYPNRSKIRDALKIKVLAGNIQVPQERLLNVPEFLDELAQAEFTPLLTAYYEAEFAARAQFELDREIEFGMTAWPVKIRSKIHALTWDRGHANGFEEVKSHYDEYVELVQLALTI